MSACNAVASQNRLHFSRKIFKKKHLDKDNNYITVIRPNNHGITMVHLIKQINKLIYSLKSHVIYSICNWCKSV